MPNSKAVFNWVVSQISLDEPPDEIKSIAYLLLEHELSLTRAQIVAQKQPDFFDQEKLQQRIARINQGEPVQYILGEQHFYGRPFKVDPRVLIPRPETELLVSCALAYTNKHKMKNPTILDIGTGSGCLAITLALDIHQVQVTGTDISEGAIALARINNLFHKATARFLCSNILTDPLPTGAYDLIVSNPPYITKEEKTAMKRNVLDFEPHLALFVPGADPLLFYREIISKGIRQLKKGGLLAVEINEQYGNEVCRLFEEFSFAGVGTTQDLCGKDRVVSGLANS